MVQKRYFFYVQLFLCLKICILCSFDIIDFDVSMGKKRLYKDDQYKKIVFSSLERWRLNTYFKKIYNKRSRFKPQPNSLIPKIIHQIWLGPNKPPKQFFQVWQQSWIKNHKEWQYILWRDEDVKKIKLENQQLFDEAKNWGEKSDILRYEIINQLGGLYVDIDFECIKPFDDLHHRFDFYTGIGPFDETPFYIGNGLIAACPGHPILKICMEQLRANRDKKLVADRTGPPFFVNILSYMLHLPECMRSIALPASYFYPVSRKQRNVGAKKKSTLAQRESFAIHHWAGTWKVPQAYIKNVGKR